MDGDIGHGGDMWIALDEEDWLCISLDEGKTWQRVNSDG